MSGVWVLVLCCVLTVVAPAQTTHALISGRVVDVQTGLGIGGAQVTYSAAATNASATAHSDDSGYYVLPLLAPGFCRVRVAADGYQPQELYALELPVAGRLDLDFRLRLLADVWQAGEHRSVFFPNSEAVLTFFGPDVDTSRYGSFDANRGRKGSLEPTVSHVIDPFQVSYLPLAGRDVYTMLLTLPGVTADTTTSRGLGLSVNGQRPSASNFLLDGLENNNYLITGPLTAIAPEAIQEYRVSTNNFSAEYGRTSGFLANAVTRAGGTQWHGLAYFYLKNDVLNANGFQDNRNGQPRRPLKENYMGFQAGGPVPSLPLFTSTAFERLRSRSFGEPTDWLLPSTRFSLFTTPDSVAARLLDRFSPPPATDGNLPYATLRLVPPLSLDRTLVLQRFDYQPEGSRHRLMARLAAATLSRPDFIWTPYHDFVSGLSQDSVSLAFTLTSYLSPRWASETRAGLNWDDLHWDRPHPEIPTLASRDGAVLPGSPAFYAYRNRTRGAEFVENLTWSRGRHVFKTGFGVLLRGLDGYLTAGRDGLYEFGDIIEFALDSPGFFSASVARASLPDLQRPEFPREYEYRQYYLFAQDAFRPTRRLSLSYGLRYEFFGAPRNTGSVKDAIVNLGTGATFAERIGSAGLTFDGSGAQRLYDTDANNWAGRFGFSYDLSGNARTVLRGSYGIFYDRPFDNLWQNVQSNSLTLASFSLPLSSRDYLKPIPEALAEFRGRAFSADSPALTLVQPGFRDAYVHSYFLGIQQQVTEDWAVEVNGLGSLGRKLITTDWVNRSFSFPPSTSNPDGRLNPALPPIFYRANQGSSNYHAMSALVRYRARWSQLQLAYTWSHAIDNQSEPLARLFFDLSATRATAGSGRGIISAFARQFDSGVDRSNSDFDQRHNLVFFSTWELPGYGRLLRGWRFSQMVAFRSGFPYTVLAPSRFSPGGDLIINNRADIVGPAETTRLPVDGGQLLLDRSLFREPPAGRLGNTGRNALRGPGLFNIDVSLSRSTALPWLGESGRLTLRADVFNVLNHANLGNPASFLTSDDFGVALYGRRGRESTFPALTPLAELARQVQLILRVEF
ncbi:MAG TPA: carboxypeptidase regulatory-like domain-containing protein [Bryobacteraceae bacterium]|nr:carboxypeptidase regulatory-like domain-containing protein [Bryobacteraceae bacterium]